MALAESGTLAYVAAAVQDEHHSWCQGQEAVFDNRSKALETGELAERSRNRFGGRVIDERAIHSHNLLV